MTKRVRRYPVAKAGEITMGWGRPDQYDEPDVCFSWGQGADKSDARFIHTALGHERMRLSFPEGNPVWEKSVFDELEERGYDLTTLKFSIRKKEQS